MRLIDADALLDFLDVGHLRPPTEICFSEIMIKNIIDMMPTVDAVPVIRCKDCKHHYYHEMLKQDYCDIPNMQFGEVDPNGYCSRAERQ